MYRTIHSETYIEKYLGDNEKIVVATGSLLCFSKGVKVSRSRNSSLLLEGPGFAFIAVTESTRTGFPRLATIGLILLAILMLEMFALHALDILQ